MVSRLRSWMKWVNSSTFSNDFPSFKVKFDKSNCFAKRPEDARTIKLPEALEKASSKREESERNPGDLVRTRETMTSKKKEQTNK